MRKLFPLIVLALLIVGCTLQQAGNIYADPTRVVLQLTQISVNATATAFSPSGGGGGANNNTNIKENKPTATIAAPISPTSNIPPTATTEPAVIALTGVSNTGSGTAQVSWSAVGSFPYGFKVLYDKSNSAPVLPSSSSQYISDPNARTAYLSLEKGVTYYFRVCRFDGNGCKVYSDVLQLTTKAVPTATTAPLSNLVITGMNQAGTGKATMDWSATGSFPNGFKIVQSETNPEPVYPGDTWTYISDGSLRAATVSGTAGHKYYFRICQYDGSGCSVYSPTYTFSFASSGDTSSESITITGANQAGAGKGILFWSATGNFPKGFKIAWSETNTAPTYPADTWVYISDGAARQAEVTGTPGHKYYFRVCKYNGSGCDFYSPTYAWAFASAPAVTKTPTVAPTPDTSTITITGAVDTTTGSGILNWTATGYFPLGFKIAYSTTNTNPVFPGDAYIYLSDPAARSTPICGTPGSTVYYRVCKYLGGACGVYSNSYAFTFALPPEPTADGSTITLDSVTIVDAASATASWTATGDFPDGFKLMWSSTSSSPDLSNSTYVWYGGTPGAITGLAPTTTYYVRVCKYSPSGCTIMSNVITYANP